MDKKNNSSEFTKSIVMQFTGYVFVGGVAFVADAAVLWICSKFIHYLCAAAIAFVFGLLVNFIMSKLFVFKTNKINKAVEFTVYFVIGIIGLVITEALMYTLTEKFGMHFMISKIITAAVVLIWNFAARKMILYRGEN